MSIGENHVVNKLEKNSKALDQQRLIRVIAKKNKEGNYESEHLKESKCISVPVIQGEFSESQLKALQPHIVGILMNAQDEIVRELIVQGGITSVHDNQISIAECIKYLDDSAKGNRITSEYMTKWFADTYFDPAAEFICELCKFDPKEISTAQETVITQKINTLASMFAGFASPKYSPDIPKCKAMLKFAEYLGEENWDDRMKALKEKVEKIKTEKEKELSMDALGF